MSDRAAIARALMDLPAGVVRWASAPAERLPRLSTGLDGLDVLLDGGWPRGRVCVLAAPPVGRGFPAPPIRDGGGRSHRPTEFHSAGRVSVAMETVAAATGQGFLAAWIDGDASLDPPSLAAAGADLQRVLWVRGPLSADRALSAAGEVLAAGGFEVVVVQPPAGGRGGREPWRVDAAKAMSPWVRLSRTAERSRSVVLVTGAPGAGDVPGAVRVRLPGLAPAWAGRPGTSALLLGGRAAVATEAGEVEVALASADCLGAPAGFLATVEGARRGRLAEAPICSPEAPRPRTSDLGPQTWSLP